MRVIDKHLGRLTDQRGQRPQDRDPYRGQVRYGPTMQRSESSELDIKAQVGNSSAFTAAATISSATSGTGAGTSTSTSTGYQETRNENQNETGSDFFYSKLKSNMWGQESNLYSNIEGRFSEGKTKDLLVELDTLLKFELSS